MEDKTELVKPDIYILDKTFPDYKQIDKTKLQMTNVAIYSVSGKSASKLLAKIIYKKMKKRRDIVITDATANVGSDSITLGLYFKKINSIELDSVNFGALKHNIDTYGLQNIYPINGNSLEQLIYLDQDVIYIDAPWGGRSYKQFSHMSLYLGKMELGDIYNKFKRKAKLFIFKVPNNYDINKFIKLIGIRKIDIYNHIDNFGKLKYMIITVKGKKE